MNRKKLLDLFFLVFVCIFLFAYGLDLMAQGNFSSQVEQNWKVVGHCEYKGVAYFLNVDTVTNERIASLYKCSNELKQLSVPKTVKHNNEKYIVRRISLTNERLETIKIPSSVWILSHLPKQLREIVFEKKSELKCVSDICFWKNEMLTKIELPASVEYIGEGAFAECKSLESITLPRYLKHLGEGTFENCTSLNNVQWTEEIYKNATNSIPQEVADTRIQRIPRSLFSECVSLEEIYFPFPLKGIGNYAFGGCKKLKRVVSVELPWPGPEIGDGAFSSCSTLVELREEFEPQNIVNVGKTLGRGAFSHCLSIEHVNIVNVDSIGQQAFFLCKSLKNIRLDARYIGSIAFDGCKSLKEAYLYQIREIDYSAFNRCSSLEKVYLDPTIEKIGGFAFSGCSSLDYISDITPNVELGEYAFSRCDKLDMTPIYRSYTHNARKNLKSQIEEWQKKKEYESTVQWRKRVTEKSRNDKIREYKDSVKWQYIQEYAPKELKCSIDSYDSDSEILKIKALNLNTYWFFGAEKLGAEKQCGAPVFTYVKVPRERVQTVRKQWENVKIEPVYCISNDYLGIASCKLALEGETYESPIIYDDETANVELNLPPLELWKDNELNVAKNNGENQPQQTIDDIDKTIPTTTLNNTNTFAVIIGNENYSQVAKVPYALNDAKIFATYCQKTLGLPQKNIKTYTDATFGILLSAVDNIKKIAEAYKGNLNVIFYYAGHGLPNEDSKDAFLLPVDADGRNTAACYATNKLYEELAGLGAKSVTVFMDACFSGAQRGEGMLASARGVAIKPRDVEPKGNMVVFSAASADETAYPYTEKGHGLFTYFLLKKLQESKGNATLGELGSYIREKVAQESIVTNGKSQTPTVVSSAALGDGWKNMRLK